MGRLSAKGAWQKCGVQVEHRHLFHAPTPLPPLQAVFAKSGAGAKLLELHHHAADIPR